MSVAKVALPSSVVVSLAPRKPQLRVQTATLYCPGPTAGRQRVERGITRRSIVGEVRANRGVVFKQAAVGYRGGAAAVAL